MAEPSSQFDRIVVRSTTEETGPHAHNRHPRAVRPRDRRVGLAFTAYVAMAAFVGKDLLTNPTFGVVYVLLWVGMVVLSVLVGPVWPLLSPVRTIHRVVSKALRTNPELGVVAYPTRLSLVSVSSSTVPGASSPSRIRAGLPPLRPVRRPGHGGLRPRGPGSPTRSGWPPTTPKPPWPGPCTATTPAPTTRPTP
jgi:hypothetical protein